MEKPAIDVIVSHRYDEPAERVFAAWLDPENAGRWLFATETGTMVRVEMDARVGEEYAIVERRDGEDVAHVGRYLVIEPPHRLVFTLQVPRYSDDVERVTIAVEPLDSGCRLTLVHPTDPAWAESTREGWNGILAGLARSLATPAAG